MKKDDSLGIGRNRKNRPRPASSRHPCGRSIRTRRDRQPPCAGRWRAGTCRYRRDDRGRSEERRGGKECVVRVDSGGRRNINKKKTKPSDNDVKQQKHTDTNKLTTQA